MTREDVIRIAQEAVIDFPNQNPFDFRLCCIETIERFAELVAAAEREACAKVCESYTDNHGGKYADCEGHGYECAAAIRARGDK